jgi:hypothetical protein
MHTTITFKTHDSSVVSTASLTDHLLSSILAAENLGDCIEWLDRNGICVTRPVQLEEERSGKSDVIINKSASKDESSATVVNIKATEEAQLYEALLHASTCGYFLIAMVLLDACADPTFGEHGG